LKPKFFKKSPESASARDREQNDSSELENWGKLEKIGKRGLKFDFKNKLKINLIF
jgi:hypothetical protein